MMNVAPNNKRSQLEDVDPSQTLVEETLTGCAHSFRQLVEQNHRRIRLYLGRYVHCSEEVDDIAQEVFCVAFSRLSHFRGEAKFSTWLIGIARNKALEFLKAETKRRTGRKQFLEAEVASQRVNRVEEQHDSCEMAERRIRAMQLCLDLLPDQSRELINRYYFDQQSASKIANSSSVSVGSIRMKLFRVRQILRKCIVMRSQEPDESQTKLEFENE